MRETADAHAQRGGVLLQERLGAGLSGYWVDDMMALIDKARPPYSSSSSTLTGSRSSASNI